MDGINVNDKNDGLFDGLLLDRQFYGPLNSRKILKLRKDTSDIYLKEEYAQLYNVSCCNDSECGFAFGVHRVDQVTCEHSFDIERLRKCEKRGSFPSELTWRFDLQVEAARARNRTYGNVAAAIFHGFGCTPLELFQKAVDLRFDVGRISHIKRNPLFFPK